MILQIGPDTGLMQDGRNTVRRQLLRGADARQHQKLRRADGARRDNDLAAGMDRVGLAVPGHIPRRWRGIAPKKNASRLRLRDHLEIGPLRRAGLRKARAVLMRRPLRCGDLEMADAFIVAAIEVGGPGDAAGDGGIAKSV